MMRWCTGCNKDTEHRRVVDRWECLCCQGGTPVNLKMTTRKCEEFGCTKPGVAFCQVAPGTNIWLCQECLDEMFELLSDAIDGLSRE